MSRLIVIEGMDGAGTTTQTKLISTYLSSLGYKVLTSAEPTGSPIGQETRRLLSQNIEKETTLLVSLALCFAADRMQHVHNTLIPGLKSHDFVILDRYVLSSLVYQGLHLPTSFIKEINRFAIKPDITIVLDINASSAYDRLKNRPGKRDFYETLALLEKIRARYLRLVEEEPTDMVLLDASGEVDDVQAHIRHVLKPFLAA